MRGRVQDLLAHALHSPLCLGRFLLWEDDLLNIFLDCRDGEHSCNQQALSFQTPCQKPAIDFSISGGHS